MATESGRTDPSLTDILFAEGFRFDFFQAVRLLERVYSQRQAVGRGVDPALEIVRFAAHLSLSFPPSAIHSLVRPSDAVDRPVMTVAFMGLTGPAGVLPRHYTELLLERERAKDRTLRDFLDLFNHRAISLFYRAWEKYRAPIIYEHAVSKGEDDDSFTLSLFDLIGMGVPGLRGRLAVDDEALPFYAGLLGQRPHSASALAGVLQDYFEVAVAVVQFVGTWLTLEDEDRSRLGPGDTNNVLGVSAVLGRRVWDQQAKFRLRLGPLNLVRFCDFLPSGRGFRPLAQLTRFFVGQEIEFDVQLTLKASEVPPCRLGARDERAPRLGWSTWLKTREFVRDAEDAVLGLHLTKIGAVA
jgi:type VI secretion system protein ImpH